MFISDAFAQGAGGSAGGGIGAILPLLAIFVIFYFLLIRPQQKRMKEHQNMLSSVRRGDRVVTGGGIIGTVTKADDDTLTVEIAPDIKVEVRRSLIAEVLSKNEPANDGGPGGSVPASGEKKSMLKSLLSGKKN